MATMTINLPNRPKGSKVEVDGLGEFENGETVELTDDQVNNYKQRMGKSFGEAFKNAYGFEFAGVEFPADEEEEEATPTPASTPQTPPRTAPAATTPTTTVAPAQSTTGATPADETKGEGDK